MKNCLRMVAGAAIAMALWGGVGAVWGQGGATPTHADGTGMNGAPTIDGAPTVNGAPTPKRAMTFADLMAMKRVSDPQISPSGKWVLFSVTDVDLGKNTKVNHLWIVSIDGGKPERQVTAREGESFGRFSPDGRWVSYTAAPTKDDPVARITVAAWDDRTGTVGAGQTLKVVSGDADGAVWSPDSRRLMFTTEVWPECSVRQPTLRGSAAKDGPPESTDGIQISGTDNVAAWKDAEAAAWAEEDACDRAKDEAAAKDPVKAQVWEGLLYRHWDQYTGAKRTHILVADLGLAGAQPGAIGSSGAVSGYFVRDVTPASAVGDAETPTWELGGPQEYAWAPDSKEIAYVTNLDPVPAASTNNDVFTLRIDEAGAGGAAKAVKVSTSPGSDDEPEYSPDGKWLAFRSQARAGFESDRFRLMLFDREKKTTRELMPKFDRWVDEFIWQPNSQNILFAAGEKGEENLSGVNVESGYFLHDITLGDGGVLGASRYDLIRDGEVSDMHFSPDGLRAVAVRMKVSRPSELVSIWLGAVVGPPHSSIEKVLTSLNDPVLQQLQMSELEPFWFTGAEGTKVEGFILRPPGFDATKKYPVKFLMHGGPQTAWGDGWSYRWNWELMAASGYVVVGINRRGSTGYGQKFVDEVSGDWGGRAYEDLMRGLDYAETHYAFIDKTRECALGASYGGFMADWVLTHTNRFQCIVTHDGLYDAAAAYGETEEMWFPEWEFRRPEDFPKGWDGFSAGYDPMGSAIKTNAGILRSAQNDKGNESAADGHAAEPWRYAALPAAEDPFRKWSPSEYIEKAKTPTLVIHSQKDMRLDVSQGFELFSALQRLGVPSKMLYFPDEGHWVLKPQNSALWYETVGDWCDRWTKTGKYAVK